MRISPAQRALLTTREQQLLETTGPYEVKQLVTLIKRSRELRDKQRDLAQRHRIAATDRSQSKASAVVGRTLKKEQLFARALEHYEAQLEKINRECSSAISELRIGAGRRGPGKAAGTASTAPKPRTPSQARKAAAAVKTGRAAKVAKASKVTKTTKTTKTGAGAKAATSAPTRASKATTKARRRTAEKAALQAMLR